MAGKNLSERGALSVSIYVYRVLHELVPLSNFISSNLDPIRNAGQLLQDSLHDLQDIKGKNIRTVCSINHRT